MTHHPRPEANTFFVNGHKCEIEYVRREKYMGKINGEEILSSHNTTHIREQLVSDAKYRVEENVEMEELGEAIADYLDGTDMWVPTDVIQEAITPEDFFSGVYEVLHIFEDEGVVEKTKYYDGLNPEDMWRLVDDQ